MNEQTAKTCAATFATALIGYFLQAALPFFCIAVLCMIVDGLVGLMNAFVKHEVSSQRMLSGIFKKLSGLMAMIIAWSLDYFVKSVLVVYNPDWDIVIPLGLVFSAWIIITEVISIFENCGKLGLPVPKIIAKSLSALQDKIGGETSEQTDLQHTSGISDTATDTKTDPEL